jgi:hypothetical protein
MSKTQLAKLAAPAGLVAAALVALLATKHGNPSPAVIGRYAIAVLASATAIVHAPTAKKAAKKLKPKRKPKPRPMFTVVYDAVTPGNIPRLASTSTDAIMAYADGLYANLDQVQRDFPRHRHFLIFVHPDDPIPDWCKGHVIFLDVENGDSTPQDAPGWCRKAHAAGAIPGLYASRDTWAQLRATLEHDPLVAGGPAATLAAIVKWDANPGTGEHIDNGYDGTQYDWQGGYDKSLFLTRRLEQ